MKYAWLVARREFLENVRTKGFWIGIFLFPAMLLLFGFVPALLENRATPSRHYVVVDASGQFEGAIEARMARHQQKRVLRAVQEYAMKHTRGAADGKRPGPVDLERTPAPGGGMQQVLDDYLETNPEVLDRLAAAGGLEVMLERLKPFLRSDAPPFKPPRALYRRVPLPAEVVVTPDLAGLAEGLKPYLRGDREHEVAGERVRLFAAVLIPAGITNPAARAGNLPGVASAGGSRVEYWAANLADLALPEEIEKAVNGELRRRDYMTRGVDPAVVAAVERTTLPLAKRNPKKETGQEAVSMADYIRQWAPSGFVYLLWVAIFSVSQMLLNNTIEEKSNRIIEVLLSSVTPGELMFGKLLGIASVGLAMVGSWLTMLVGILWMRAGPEAEFARQLLLVIRSSPLLPAFLVYFLLGYLMYAGLILSLGSVCNTLKEAQNYMGVVMLILMVPMLTMFYIPKDPNGTLATILSWIPLYTPFAMMNRITADPPWVDVIGTMVVLSLSTVAVIWMAGRIFRVGILRTGQPPRLLELLRWLRPGP